jgi:hypothetical protein
MYAQRGIVNPGVFVPGIAICALFWGVSLIGICGNCCGTGIGWCRCARGSGQWLKRFLGCKRSCQIPHLHLGMNFLANFRAVGEIFEHPHF